jgi:hypothetical protein
VCLGVAGVNLRPKTQSKEEKVKSPRSPKHRSSILSKLGSRFSRTKKRKEKEEGEGLHLTTKKHKEDFVSNSLNFFNNNNYMM